ncbi:MAG: hypothetical protein K2Q18_13885 [Bdellovibrionales bacterium]|nr:hypothetical protein [Bdellovibrionales bacterium]
MTFRILITVVFIISMSAYSQDQINLKELTQSSVENTNLIERWWKATKNNFSFIHETGKNDLYLMGYAYHDRNTYTKEKLSELNEGAFGLGYGRSVLNESGNSEMLYLMAHLDSHKDVQINAGYAWLKNFKIYREIKFGLGYSAFLVSRSDFAGRFPLPFALPMVTCDFGKVTVNGILIPKLNNGINNGNVFFIFAKFSWDRKKQATF